MHSIRSFCPKEREKDWLSHTHTNTANEDSTVTSTYVCYFSNLRNASRISNAEASKWNGISQYSSKSTAEQTVLATPRFYVVRLNSARCAYDKRIDVLLPYVQTSRGMRCFVHWTIFCLWWRIGFGKWYYVNGNNAIPDSEKFVFTQLWNEYEFWDRLQPMRDIQINAIRLDFMQRVMRCSEYPLLEATQ